MHFSILLSSAIYLVSTMPSQALAAGETSNSANPRFQNQQEAFQSLRGQFYTSMSAFEKETLDNGEYGLRKRARLARKYGDGAEAGMKRNIVRIVEGEFSKDVVYLAQDWPRADTVALLSMNELNPIRETQEKAAEILVKLRGSASTADAAVVDNDEKDIADMKGELDKITATLTAASSPERLLTQWFGGSGEPKLPFNVDDYLAALVKQGKSNAQWQKWTPLLRERVADYQQKIDWDPQMEGAGPSPRDGTTERVRKSAGNEKYLQFAVEKQMYTRFTEALATGVSLGLPVGDRAYVGYLNQLGLGLSTQREIEYYKRNGGQPWNAETAKDAVARINLIVLGEGSDRNSGINVALARGLGIGKAGQSQGALKAAEPGLVKATGASTNTGDN